MLKIWKNSRKYLNQLISIALGFVLAFALMPICAAADGFSVGLSTDDFSFGYSTGDTVGGSNQQPGCDGDNCLIVPNPNEYGGIAGNVSLREAIIKWTNFFLGFLALIAMIALIFAGFLYVTAAGNSEQADKAKKIIIWVVLGIIVILIAYALVNTLITTGPKGDDQAV